MGIIWSSPYRWQIIEITSWMLLLITGFVFILLSIGFNDITWRIIGGVFAVIGTCLSISGTCWCVHIIRKGKYGVDGAMEVPDHEVETLTSEMA